MIKKNLNASWPRIMAGFFRVPSRKRRHWRTTEPSRVERGWRTALMSCFCPDSAICWAVICWEEGASWWISGKCYMCLPFFRTDITSTRDKRSNISLTILKFKKMTLACPTGHYSIWWIRNFTRNSYSN